MDSASVPKLASLQHVIGHKKLQLCINLLRFCLHWHWHSHCHWSLEEGWKIEWNRIASQRVEAKPSEGNWIEWGQRQGWGRVNGERMARTTRTPSTSTSTWSAYHYMPSNFNVEPFGQQRQLLLLPGWAQQHLISVVNDENIIICRTSLKAETCNFLKQPRG